MNAYHARMIKRLFFALLVLAALNRCAFSEVLIIADEFPAMKYLAGKLKSEEHIESKLVAQADLPPDLSLFEAVIVYIHKDLLPGTEEALITYTQTGGKLVLLHHSISSGKARNTHWFSFLGVKLPTGDVKQGGYKYREGITWSEVNLNPTHFIMTNKVTYPERIAYSSPNVAAPGGTLPGFTLKDSEVYLNHVHTGPHTLLMGLKYRDADSGVIYMQDRSGWTKPSGKGWIIYLMPGHTKGDFENSTYRRIVLNAVIYKP